MRPLDDELSRKSLAAVEENVEKLKIRGKRLLVFFFSWLHEANCVHAAEEITVGLIMSSKCEISFIPFLFIPKAVRLS